MGPPRTPKPVGVGEPKTNATSKSTQLAELAKTVGAESAPTALDLDATQDDVRPVEVRTSAPVRLLRNSRYELVRLIGEGGMGEVSECRDLVIERSVALKTIRRDRQAKHLEARFVREACVQAQLEHPSVVPVFEVGRDDDGGAFFTMRKVSGIPLDEILDRKRKGDPRMMTERSKEFSRHHLLTAFAQICMTVHYAHARGVLHRDIKPSNIMLGDFGEVYVLDWGLAKLAPVPAVPTTEDRNSGNPGDASPSTSSSSSSSTPSVDHLGGLRQPPKPPGDRLGGLRQPPKPPGDRALAHALISSGKHQTAVGTALGTPAYMPPEQVAARQLDARADVFALGAVLFEILTLEPLLDDAAVEMRLRGGTPVWDARPSVRAPDQMVPPEFDRICVRATAADVDKRYASARALNDVVEAYLDGERDQDLRTNLASTLLTRAQEALVTGDAKDRDGAFRDVNRALALAPDDPRGLELLVELLKETSGASAKAREEVVAEGLERQRRSQPLGVLIFVVPWLTMYPLLVWLRGVKSMAVAAVPLAGWIIAALANYIDHRRRSQDKVIYPTVAIMVAIGLTSLVFGPLFILPQLATTILAGIVLISARRQRLKMITLAVAAVLVPTTFVWAGIHEVYRFENESTLVLTSLFKTIRPRNLSVLLTLIDVLTLFGTSLFASRLRDDIENARSAKVLFAWQLSKLLPQAISDSRGEKPAVAAEEAGTAKKEKKKRTVPTTDSVERLLDTEIDSAPLKAYTPTTLTRADGEQASDESGGTTAYPLLSLEGSRYVQGELLIEGKAAEVYRVRDRLVGREVAMKRLRSPQQTTTTTTTTTTTSSDSGAASATTRSIETAFTREALLQAHLEHPCVPPVYDLGHDEHGPWFTMKLVRGAPLSEELQLPSNRNGSARVEDAQTRTQTSAHGRHQRLAAFAKVCLTIDFAHQHGVIHAALDPSKIVLGEFGEVYVLGWRHAKRIAPDRVKENEDEGEDGTGPSSLDSSETKADYVAPEQIANARAVSTRTDIFALGAILFEIASGGKPASSGARIGRELDEICAKATARDPKDRYSSARKLHDAVESFLSSDRDESLRRDLAAERLARAEAKIERAADDVATRVEVLREVGRALALAPDRTAGMRLLTRLLSSSPKQMPPAVEEEIRKQVWATSQAAAWPGAFTNIVLWLGIFPLYCWSFGVRDLRMAIAMVAAWILFAVVLFSVYRFRREEPRIPWVGITSAIAVGMTSLLFGGYFIVPGLAISLTLAYMLTVGTRWRWTAFGMMGLALVIPLILMWTGVSSVLQMPGGEATTGTFIIRGAVFHPSYVFLFGLTLMNLINVVVVGFFAGRFRDMLDELEAENRAKVYALSRLL